MKCRPALLAGSEGAGAGGGASAGGTAVQGMHAWALLTRDSLWYVHLADESRGRRLCYTPALLTPCVWCINLSMQKLAALQQENAALRQQLGLAPAAAPAAGTSSSQAAAAAAGAAPGLKSAEVYVLGGVEDRGEAGDDNSWLSSVLIYSPRSQSWRQGGCGAGRGLARWKCDVLCVRPAACALSVWFPRLACCLWREL